MEAAGGKTSQVDLEKDGICLCRGVKGLKSVVFSLNELLATRDRDTTVDQKIKQSSIVP